MVSEVVVCRKSLSYKPVTNSNNFRSQRRPDGQRVVFDVPSAVFGDMWLWLMFLVPAWDCRSGTMLIVF